MAVDDKEAVRNILDKLGIELLLERFLDFHDPWGNRIEIVEYEGIQFTKAENALKGVGLEGLGKSEKPSMS